MGTKEVIMGANEELVKAIVSTAGIEDDKKFLSCAEAFDLAKKFDVKIAEIGDICNDQDIKLKECQLGCF